MDQRTRRLAGASVALTFVLVLLGVYTAAAGAGLTCGQRWPLCDGAVFGLFPADFPSFVEWFHRLWAMITGFVVIGATISAWRGEASRRVAYALAGATLILPSQIVLGALTVTRYELLILVAHFVTAFAILTLLVAAAVWAYEGSVDLPARRRQAALLAAGLLPFYALLSPRLVFVYSPAVQVAFYAVGMAVYAALVAVALTSGGRIRALAGGGSAVLFVELVAGRQSYGATGELLMVVGALVTFVVAGVVAWRLHAERDARRPTGGDGAASGD
ncbi:COX15/CtaA family protein [Salinirubellus sp. GCM10025818]|uniref:COX15/CtaA family protein n=1 Tax=Salinirubellus TaxID=2162630 RepID=UPI0030CC290F